MITFDSTTSSFLSSSQPAVAYETGLRERERERKRKRERE
jgi:hypothetical protein